MAVRPRELPDGVYEQVITDPLAESLAALVDRQVARAKLDGDRSAAVLARHFARELERVLGDLRGSDRLAQQLALTNRLLAQLGTQSLTEAVAHPPELLQAIFREVAPPRPVAPLATSTLLTRGRGEPAIGHELRAEVASADRIDVIVAFITIDGLRTIRSALDSFAARAGARLRLLTTVFGGITGAEALDALATIPGVEVKVSFDVRRTRLHAKAWLFHRDSGLHTAYVGSANLTSTGLMGGHEWMVKVSAADLAHVVDKFAGTFETLWNDGEFERYDPDDDAVRERVALASKTTVHPASAAKLLFALRPLPFQEEVLDRLEAERLVHGRHRNLVVAATGTGKTVMAALDYARQAQRLGASPSLLFVAHRRELLLQARETFQHALQHGGFGELWTDGERPSNWQHVFASIQSAGDADELRRLGPEHFRYVVIDECHHAPAKSYQALLPMLRPEILLGLTATPERTDGRSLLPDFCGCIAAELRLWHALDRQLLAPFEYFGINDGVDLSRVRWSRSGYDARDLETVYDGNEARIDLIVGELARRVDDVRRVRALAFCVSVEHARFTADALTRRGLPALAVDGTSEASLRNSAPDRLRAREVNVLCTCDLYNEGIDLPFVDTLMLLRPTQSATLFLQQLGRGLRHFEGKRACLVLDFIGQHRAEFRYDAVLSAMTGVPRAELHRAAEAGFPWLPSGCVLQLDAISHARIIEALRRQRTGGRRIVEDLRELARREGPQVSLARYLAATGRELAEVYKDGSWTQLRRKAGLLPEDASDSHALSKRFGRLLHVDERARLLAWTRALELPANDTSSLDRTRLAMLDFELHERGVVRAAEETVAYLARDPAVRDEFITLANLLDEGIALPREQYPVAQWPLALHRHYSRREIMAAVGYVKPGQKGRTPQGGILKLEHPDGAGGREILLVTLDKSDHSFSPTTRYRDYAISPSLFHWETQGAASVERPSGRRYLDSPGNAWSFFLFVRAHADARYAFLGPVRYVSHTGDRPIGITWELDHPMPAALFDSYASLVQG